MKSENAMTKAEFMAKVINDKYKKRFKETRNEADVHLFEAASSRKTYAQRKSKRWSTR